MVIFPRRSEARSMYHKQVRKILHLILFSLIALSGCDKRSEYEKMSLKEKSQKENVFSNAIKYHKNDKRINEVSYLLKTGIPATITDTSGTPVLHLAFKSKSPQTAQLLIQHGADIHARDADSATALHYACIANQPDMVEELLKRHADPNACTKRFNLTPLTMALPTWLFQPSVRFHKTLQILIDHGADVKAVDNRGNTTLLRALHAFGSFSNQRVRYEDALRRYDSENINIAGYGSTKSDDILPVLTLLAEKGASPTLKNTQGRSAVSFAKELYDEYEVKWKKDSYLNRTPIEKTIPYKTYHLLLEYADKEN